MKAQNGSRIIAAVSKEIDAEENQLDCSSGEYSDSYNDDPDYTDGQYPDMYPDW
jgi:hypothetical protein